LKISAESIDGKEQIWNNPKFSTIRNGIRWGLNRHKDQSLSLHSKDITLIISGNPPPEGVRPSDTNKAHAYMIRAECSQGWRNLVNTEFTGTITQTIGGQLADYPAGSFASHSTTLRIVQTFYETGNLDDKVVLAVAENPIK